jgi:hypothetical protein
LLNRFASAFLWGKSGLEIPACVLVLLCGGTGCDILFGRHTATVGVFQDESKVAQNPKKFRKECGKVAAIILSFCAGVHLNVLGQVYDEAEVGQRSLVDGTGGVVPENVKYCGTTRVDMELGSGIHEER